MKIIKYFLIIICLTAILAFTFSDKEPHQGDNIVPRYPLIVGHHKNMDANTICTIFYNYGSFNYDLVNGDAGFKWPRISPQYVGQCLANVGETAVFASGLWLGAVVGTDTLVSCIYHNFDFVGGYTDASGNPQGKDENAYRVYKLVKGRPENEGNDRTEWPNTLLGNSDQNAPVYFDSASSTWKALDLGDQTMHYSYTDSYPEYHGSRPGAGSLRPLKADVKQTNFAFDLNGPLGQMIFTVITVTNRSNQEWRDIYMGMWSDDDLGSGGTCDHTGCDSVRNLGYTYNVANGCNGGYSAPSPSTGMAFFRGAITYTGNPADTAYVCDGKTRVAKVGFKDLGMTAFNWFANQSGPLGDPSNFRESYNFLRGLRKDGTPLINPVYGYETKFIYTGDPVTNQGWVHSGPGVDCRDMMNTGPFNLLPDSSQTIITARIIARGNNNLNSIEILRNFKDVSQNIYDHCFRVPSCAPPPTTSYFAPGNGKIYLTWDDADEKLSVPNELSHGTYKFQGYNIYQIKAGTNGLNKPDRELLATFDIKDGITNIKDTIKDEYGETVVVVVQKGTDNGISRYLVLDKDKFQNGLLINGTPYYFSVTAYHQDSLAGPTFATPRVCESSISGGMITVIPQRLVQGTQTFYNVGDTISTDKRDLAVMPIVLEPLLLITASYTSTFAYVNNQLTWSMTRNGVPVVVNNADMSASQDTAVVVDGFFPLHRVVGDSGLIKDADLGAVLGTDIYTRVGGWSYTPPENRWVQGPSQSAVSTEPFFGGQPTGGGRQFQSRQMGVSFPQGAPNPTFRGAATKFKANGPYLYPVNGILNGGPLRKVRIVFSSTQTQLAYRYVGSSLNNTPYVDYVPVPFQAFEVEDLDSSASPRQINVAFIDLDSNGVWDPDTSALGKRQITYFFASTYDATPNSVYTSKNLGFTSNFSACDIMYAWLPRVIKNGPGIYTDGDQLELYPYIPTRPEFVPGYQIRYDWTVQGSIIANSSLASQGQMDNVKVFPNPYYGQSRLEKNSIGRFIYFSNLPKECTIYIYTLNGVLVRKIYRNVTDPRNSLEKWNLRNDNDVPIASGMYIALVDAPGIGTKTLKLAVFTPEERLQTF